MNNKKRQNNQQLIDAVKNSLSYAEVIRKLNLIPAGGNYDTVKRCIKELNLDTSHMTNQGWNTGERYKTIRPVKPLEEILTKNSTFINSYKLKYKLLKENIKEHKCEMCNNTIWLNREIPLELHHINGDKHDNRIGNLQLLCPNCHALTDNYRGKNIKQVA